MAYLHPLVVYAFFGLPLGTALASVAVAFRPGLPPAVKRGIWWVPLTVPFAAYAVSWTWRWYAPCRAWMLAGHGYDGTFLAWLCRAGTALAYVLAPFFAVAVAAGVAKALVAAWLAGRWWRRFGAATAGSRVSRTVVELASRMGLKPPAVMVAPHPFGQAFTVGIRRPVVVLSRDLVSQLDDEELAAVLAHELAHVEAGDHAKKWLAVMLRDILFFTGLSFLVFRHLQAEMEVMADARSAQVTGTPLALAAALIKGWRLQAGGGWRQVALDNFAPLLARGEVRSRVERLLAQASEPPPSAPGWRWLPPAVGLLTGVVALLFC